MQTLGGYWPDPEEGGDHEDTEPSIIMESMTCNLLLVLDKQLLESIESKRRILKDVAAGIAHLHSRRIVHRDTKPENFLIQVVDGQIIGRAKICDFGVSRNAEETLTATMDPCT